MNYNEAVFRMLDSIGGTDNILKIKRNQSEITIIVYDDRMINLESLNKVHPKIKRTQVIQNRIILYLRRRDVSGIFEAFKTLPDVRVHKLNNSDEEAEKDLNLFASYYRRLRKAPYGNYVPFVFTMVGIGYLVGIANFIAHLV